MTRETMPIMSSVLMAGIPFAMIAPHERQAQKNHGQSLEKLAGRGGLSVSEAIAILDDRDHYNMGPSFYADTLLINLVRAWRAEGGKS